MNIIDMNKFLDDLAKNNNLTWMHEHQKEYKGAKQYFLDLMQELVFSLGKSDALMLEVPVAKRISRLARDTRFSNDKSPYKTAFTMHLSVLNSPIPTKPFIHLQPEMNFVGGGIFMDNFKEITTRIREAIIVHEDEFLQIVENLKKEEIKVLGSKLKKVPKEYDDTLRCAEYLKHKSWFIEAPLISTDETQLLHELQRNCELVTPFNNFINRALEGFEMPRR